ncbi:MAG: NAD(P)-binding protein [Syntrophorhabdales bacterium]
MADKSYDVVVVGGGGNALVTSLYLARNGMKVGVFDRRYEGGGEFCTDETLMPGFIMNTCATFIRFFLCPAVYDFKLRQYGLDMVFPEPSQSHPCGRLICQTIFLCYILYHKVSRNMCRFKKIPLAFA